MCGVLLMQGILGGFVALLPCDAAADGGLTMSLPHFEHRMTFAARYACFALSTSYCQFSNHSTAIVAA